MNPALTFDSILHFAQSTAAGYSLLVTMWIVIVGVSQRVALRKAKADNDERERIAKAKVADLDRQAETLSTRNNKYKDDIATELERRNRSLSNISRALRKLLKQSMTHSDNAEKWALALETYVKVHNPQLVAQKVPYDSGPTADDVAAVYAENGSDEGTI